MLILVIALAACLSALSAASARAQSPKDPLSSGSSTPSVAASNGAKVTAPALRLEDNISKDDERQRLLLVFLLMSGGRTPSFGTMAQGGHSGR